MIHRIIKLLLVFMFLVMNLVCEARPSRGGAVSRGVYMAYKSTQDPDALSFVLWGVVILLVLGVVVITLQGLCKLIKFAFHVLVVDLPWMLWEEKLFIRLLWRKKLFIPALWASIFKLPWLLQVK